MSFFTIVRMKNDGMYRRFSFFWGGDVAVYQSYCKRSYPSYQRFGNV